MSDEEKRGKPRPKKRKAQRKRPRHKLKIQTTVRLEEKLLKATQTQAEKERLTVTDLIEEGLWLYLQRNLEEEQMKELLLARSLIRVIPLHVRDLTIDFWLYMLTRFDDLFDGNLHRLLGRRLIEFRTDPRREAKLDELLKLLVARAEGREEEMPPAANGDPAITARWRAVRRPEAGG